MTFGKLQLLYLRSAASATAAPAMPTPRTVLTATAAALAFGLVVFSFPSYAQPTTTSAAESSVVAQASSAHSASEDRSIRPFKVRVPQAALDDLRRRISATRWPDKETVADRRRARS